MIPISTRQENVTEHDYQHRAQLFSIPTTLLLRRKMTLIYVTMLLPVHIIIIPLLFNMAMDLKFLIHLRGTTVSWYGSLNTTHT